MTTVKFLGKEIRFPDRDEADKSVIREIFFWREYRAAEELIAKAKTIVDVGAHLGVFSAYVSLLNPLAKVYALEPEPDNFSKLKETIKMNNFPGIKILAQALARDDGPRELFLAPDSINHSLLFSDSAKTIKISAISLSSLIKKTGEIDVLKMDIEGGEYELLDGWRVVDLAKVKSIVLEYHQIPDRRHRELEEKLRTLGFSVQIFPSRFDKNLGFILARNKLTKI